MAGARLWAIAVNEAMQRAHAHFAERADTASLKRLPRAQAIVLEQDWARIGDAADTWLIPSATTSGVVYEVNGRCTCRGIAVWCQYRLARALAKRAEEIMQARAEASGSPHKGHAQRIDLIVAHEAGEERTLPHVNGNGRSSAPFAAGTPTPLPVPTAAARTPSRRSRSVNAAQS